MTPELSRACALVKHTLNLESGGAQMNELLASAANASGVEDLPNWARATLAYAQQQELP